MGTAIKHPVPDRVQPPFVILTSWHSDAQGWPSECPGVKNYKWRLNPVWHRMFYSCTHMATVESKGWTLLQLLASCESCMCVCTEAMPSVPRPPEKSNPKNIRESVAAHNNETARNNGHCLYDLSEPFSITLMSVSNVNVVDFSLVRHWLKIQPTDKSLDGVWNGVRLLLLPYSKKVAFFLHSCRYRRLSVLQLTSSDLEQCLKRNATHF